MGALATSFTSDSYLSEAFLGIYSGTFSGALSGALPGIFSWIFSTFLTGLGGTEMTTGSSESGIMIVFFGSETSGGLGGSGITMG